MATRKKTPRKPTRKKVNNNGNRASMTGKIVLSVLALMLMIGMGVMFYLSRTSDMDYEPFYELAEANENYLIENQAEIMGQIRAEGVEPQRLGHVFVSEEPATYIDIQHVPQHNVPYLNQNDPRWRNADYGTDGTETMWENGCAIVVLAMVEQYYTGNDTSPRDILKWSGNDYYMHLQGSTWQIYPAFGQAYGYDVIDYGNDFHSAVSMLDQGYLVIVSVGPGTFTDGGHVMLIRGYYDGLVYLNDPNDAPDKLFSIQGIPAQTVINDSLNYWAIKPY